MKTSKLLIKMSFFNKINDFLCFNSICMQQQNQQCQLPISVP